MVNAQMLPKKSSKQNTSLGIFYKKVAEGRITR
jgi:hypothetical protein